MAARLQGGFAPSLTIFHVDVLSPIKVPQDTQPHRNPINESYLAIKVKAQELTLFRINHSGQPSKIQFLKRLHIFSKSHQDSGARKTVMWIYLGINGCQAEASMENGRWCLQSSHFIPGLRPLPVQRLGQPWKEQLKLPNSCASTSGLLQNPDKGLCFLY